MFGIGSVCKEVAWNKIFSEGKIQLGGDYDRILNTQKPTPPALAGSTAHCLFQYTNNRALGGNNRCQNQVIKD